MKKYIYEYVRIEMPQSFIKFPVMEEHREIISEYGSKGWRYVGNIRISQTNAGGSLGYDLIFEKEIEWTHL